MTTHGGAYVLLVVVLTPYSWQARDHLMCQGLNLVGLLQGKCPTHQPHDCNFNMVNIGSCSLEE